MSSKTTVIAKAWAVRSQGQELGRFNSRKKAITAMMANRGSYIDRIETLNNRDANGNYITVSFAE